MWVVWGTCPFLLFAVVFVVVDDADGGVALNGRDGLMDGFDGAG